MRMGDHVLTETASTGPARPIAVKFRVDRQWLGGIYEVHGRMLVARCGDHSISACIGLLDHKKLAKALLIKLHARNCCPAASVSAEGPCGHTPDTAA